jgi:hypothetical protein
MKRRSSSGWRRCGSVVALSAVLGLAAAGCAGYRLGSTLPPNIKTVHVSAFLNKSGEPQLENSATRAAIQEFQRDGTLKVLDKDQADTIVEVTLTGYRLEPLVYSRDNTSAPSQYRLSMTADMVMKLRTTGAVMTQKSVTGETTFNAAGGLTAAKLQAQPAACRDLAHSIVESVVEFW